ncbi:hypothetical protein [Nocardia abscessus]|uniref:hypothetical protein n=1 Tax=Nocardia abscessus TaxID=120957 RepID=UPI0024551218|nr:hypothetical protein [Nocardia abscessus]
MTPATHSPIRSRALRAHRDTLVPATGTGWRHGTVAFTTTITDRGPEAATVRPYAPRPYPAGRQFAAWRAELRRSGHRPL